MEKNYIFKVFYDGNSVIIKNQFSVIGDIIGFSMWFLLAIATTVATTLTCIQSPIDTERLIIMLLADAISLTFLVFWFRGSIDDRNFALVIDKKSVKVLTTKNDFIIPFDESFSLNLMYDVIIKGYRRRIDNFVCLSSVAVEDEEMRKKLLNSAPLYYIENTEESKMIGLRCFQREKAEELYRIIKNFLEQA